MYSYISLLTIREESKWDSLSHSDLKAFRDRNGEGMDVLCLMKCVLKISFKFLHFAFCIYIKNFRIIPVPIYSFSFSYIRLLIISINIGFLVICIGILFSHDAFCLWILLFEYRIADLTTVGFIWFDAAFTAGSPPVEYMYMSVKTGLWEVGVVF